MTDPIYGPAGALGFTCFWCKTWFPKAEHDAHAVACPKLVELFFPRGGVWTGVTQPTPEMLAEAMTLSRCAYVSEHGERCQRVPVIGFAGHCQMHGGDFAREFMGPGTPSELDRLRAENAALRAKLDRVVGVLDGLIAEVKET